MFAQLLARIVAPKVDRPVMAPEDIEVIRAFAQGDESLRAQAITVHNRNIKVIGIRGNVFMRFMAEVDTPFPDLGLRNDLRHKVLAA